MSIIDSLTCDDLSENQQELVDILGFDVFINLVKNCGGTAIYIPHQEAVERAKRNKRIKAEFNGGNYKELAKKFKVSEVWARKIVSEKECI